MKKIFTLCIFIFQSILLFAGAPNPASSSVKINMNNNNRNNAALLIYDINGRLLQQQPVNNNSLVNIDKLKQGIYYFVLQDGASRYTKKLIKQ